MAVCNGMVMDRFKHGVSRHNLYWDTVISQATSHYPSLSAWEALRRLRPHRLDGANISQRWLFHIFDGMLETSWVETRESYLGLAPSGTSSASCVDATYPCRFAQGGKRGIGMGKTTRKKLRYTKSWANP
ncbi:hypothetical protein CIB48_g7505 [Xylaria polymorpha]|nr:hypothetical protein CIB48_g7505 [Xylaria polymorpha]